MSRTDSGAFYMVKGLHARHTGRRGAAVAYCDSAAAVFAPFLRDDAGAAGEVGGNAVPPLMVLAPAHACRGRPADARRAANALRAVLARPHTVWERSGVLFALAMVDVFLGDRDSAVAYLERAVPPPTTVSGNWLRLDPVFAPLRGHPGFERMLAGP